EHQPDVRRSVCGGDWPTRSGRAAAETDSSRAHGEVSGLTERTVALHSVIISPLAPIVQAHVVFIRKTTKVRASPSDRRGLAENKHFYIVRSESPTVRLKADTTS